LHEILIEAAAFVSVLATLLTIPWILMTKKDSTSAVAWCLLVFFLPLVGSLAFVMFGWQHVTLPLKRKRRHRVRFGRAHARARREAVPGQAPGQAPDTSWAGMGRL